MAAVTPMMIASTALSLHNTNMSNKAAKQKSQANAAQIGAKRVAAERIRVENLKRQKATQTARFGAMGIGANDGSSAAILSGLQSQSDAKAADRSRIYESGVSNGAGANLLAQNSKLILNNLDKLISSS